ncbi:MAG: hypothetical protein IIW64_04055 [Selenomonadaceae bacterium]|nr:hypothetical protein [Selenomonadaceae bacterium]
MNNENENKKENQNENDEMIEFRPRNNELILQCATDILFKAGFTPESLLAMNSMQKNMFIDVYLLDILTSDEKTYEEIEGAYHIIDFMIPPEKKEFE